MKITFIIPCIGREKTAGSYLKGWSMEPLAIAVLSALTPAHIERVFYDDRIEQIPFDEATDLVAISVETYTARRAYQIAAEYRKRSVPVVLGGFHPTFMPDEALQYADAVVIGEAENIWPQVVDDCGRGQLQKKYQAASKPSLENLQVDRSIYADKKYLKLSLVETGRGCNFTCEFCSITSFFQHSHRSRPIREVVDELQTLSNRHVFFVDDNIGADIDHAKQLFQALIPLNIRWTSQMSINIANDESVLALMQQSGCVGVLIGFESLDARSLNRIGKKVNRGGVDYSENLAKLRKHGIAVYGTFIFGYDTDTEQSFATTLEFARKEKIFLAAFNHLVPFPGTALFKRLQKEKKLLNDQWWLAPSYRFGDVAFQPEKMTPEQLARLCFSYRQQFYSLPSIFRRSLDFQANCCSLYMAMLYFSQNFFNGREVRKRQGLPLGVRE
jgi:radical SAM superfamily enzyme YgiQ (UPF0313 family)